MNPLSEWLTDTLGQIPKNAALYEQALTHSSHSRITYERLEFLGDRVLGLVIADTLYQTYPQDEEGKLSHRLNTLVARAACADVGRAIGLASRMRLGKQALEDGAFDSQNVLGDVVEALIGALFIDHGLEAARAFILRHWDEMITGQISAPRHPKSELQEWAAANNRKSPHYEVLERSGPDHAPQFKIRVSVGSAGHAEASAKSKQEAERLAAEALLRTLT